MHVPAGVCAPTCAVAADTCTGPGTTGVDNDCDGAVEEGVPGLGQRCGTSTGACSSGLTACVNGAIVCQGGVGPQLEICDDIDNDCNGVVDDACVPLRAERLRRDARRSARRASR